MIVVLGIWVIMDLVEKILIGKNMAGHFWCPFWKWKQAHLNMWENWRIKFTIRLCILFAKCLHYFMFLDPGFEDTECETGQDQCPGSSWPVWKSGNLPAPSDLKHYTYITNTKLSSIQVMNLSTFSFVNRCGGWHYWGTFWLNWPNFF